ncbi:MAG: 4-(cytidine 5'-diphospho)-2-C-methyl-D-erythritol kinase [Bacteroidales bacterium]|nr:4-(cytidine 5'-diphospho)-2-C-methyl-D-erythritol kinase [Bacteroidales bacterium]
MILFSPAKINLGLQILERREDGFHTLRSVMYPTDLCDIIEINQLPEGNPPVCFTQSGIRFDADLEDNLCIRAWKLLASECSLPPVSIHLHKQIPVGAGLGGGSSNASTILKGLHQIAGSTLPAEKMAQLAGQLGSDCPFFLQDEPMMMEGRGEILSQVKVSLDDFYLVLLFPEIHISSAEAYSTVSPAIPEQHLRQLIEKPINEWKESIVNDFEKKAFRKYPILEKLKHSLYNSGARYASMSGSGSALYGIFETLPDFPGLLRRFMIWKGPA